MKKLALCGALTLIIASLVTACVPVMNASSAVGAGSLTALDTLELDIKISEFTTEFDEKDSGRTKNIELASKAINGRVINPGEALSFNEAVGPTNKRNGFKKAVVFEKGKKTSGYGGGVCQVSSTLYNAVLLGGLETVEVHRHSLPVYYVEDGKDAATSYGTLDYIFRNNTSVPVRIASYTHGNKITVALHYASPLEKLSQFPAT